MYYRIFQIYSPLINESYIHYTSSQNLPKVFAFHQSNHTGYIMGKMNSRYQNYFRIFDTGSYEIKLLEEVDVDSPEEIRERVKNWIKKIPHSFGKNCVYSKRRYVK
jgi:hypothetical protein